MRKLRLPKWFLIAGGLLSVALGFLGIFLPLLPTTPFLLLAAACFCRSSERLYRWLMNHKWFGPIIRNYREHRAIPLKAKIITLVMLWLSIGYSAFFVIELVWVRVLLLVIATGVTLHVGRLRTLPPPPRLPQPGAEELDSCS